jgi:glycine/D-amino acid oxidase-like deaminating enzyme
LTASHAPADVVVFGSGVTGCLVALELAQSGRRTVVVPREDDLVLGHVPSGPPVPYAEAVERWGRNGAAELWRWQGRAHAALRELLDGWGDACERRAAGGFTLALDRTHGVPLADSEDLLRDDGFPGEFLDGYMLEARFGVRGFAAGYWSEGEAELDAEALTRRAAAAASAAGAVFAAAAAAAPVFSSKGVRVDTAHGPVSGRMAVVAAASVAPAVAPLQDRVDVRSRRMAELSSGGGVSLPSPARVTGSGARWASAGRRVTLEVSGGGDPAAFAADHLPELCGWRPAGPGGRHGLSRDALPWVGRVPGLPVFAALAGSGDLAWEPLLSRWAVAELLTGRDATPAPFRAARAGSDML